MVIRLASLAVALALPAAARAGETPCWFDAGVLIAPAEVAGVAGDYIIDTGSPRTLLDETRAQTAGFEDKVVAGGVRIAGFALPDRAVGVQALDVRTWNLPTPAAGVIGADVLQAYVVDVSFAPCRLALWRPGEAPRFRGGTRLALGWDGGRPVVEAAAYDGARAATGPFVLATGANAPARLAEDVADVPGAPKPEELREQGVWLARLVGLELAGVELKNLGAGLMAPSGEAAGLIGGPALARFRLRFDFPAGEVRAAKR